MRDKEKLSIKKYVIATASVAKVAFLASPVTVCVKIAGALLTAILPIVVTYFAAQTTTALAEAYTGDPNAGARAIEYVIITVVLGIGLTAWSSLESYVSEFARYKIDAAVTDRMYEHFLSLDFWRYDDKESIDLFDRASKFALFIGYVVDRLTGILTQFFVMVAGLIAMIMVSWWLGLIVLVAVIPGIFIQFRLAKLQSSHWNDNVETRRAKSMIEMNMFKPDGMAELRLYGMVRRLLDIRMTLRDKDEKARIEFERSFVLKRLGGDVIESGAELTALLYTTMQIIAQAQPIGQFLYVQQIVSRAIGGAGSFVSQLSQIDEEMAQLFDYQKFMELPARTGGDYVLQSPPKSIEIVNVSFRYPHTDSDVLKDISLTITHGQNIAIVGENGAGKSSLVKILTGLYLPTKGAVLVDGKDLATVDIASWHNYISALQQDYLRYIFTSVKENVYFGDVGRPFDQKRYTAAITNAEADKMIAKLPKKDDSYIITWMQHEDGTPGVSLSGGQSQRLALARNFYRDSPIIILDEPTSAIDALAESRIFKHLFAAKNRTVITISHRLTTVEKADVIYMLQNGKVVEQGTHKELVANKGSYYTMFESQLRLSE